MKIIMVLKRVMFFQVFQRFKLVVPGFYWCLAEFQDRSRNKVDINWSYLSRGNEVLNHGSEFMVPHVQTIPLKIKHDTNMTHVFFQTPHVFKSMVPCIYLILTMNIPHLSFIFIISPWYFSHRSDPFILILPTPASRSLIRITKRRGGSSPRLLPGGPRSHAGCISCWVWKSGDPKIPWFKTSQCSFKTKRDNLGYSED